MHYEPCTTCAGAGYLDDELDADEPAAVACTTCCSYGWFDLETGKPADVEPPLFTLTEEGILQ
jgi:hypothetical protein